MNNKRRKVTKARLKERRKKYFALLSRDLAEQEAKLRKNQSDTQLRAVAIFGLEPEEGFSTEQLDVTRWTLEIDQEILFMREEQELAGSEDASLRDFVLNSAREQAEFTEAYDSEHDILRPLKHPPQPSPHLLAATKFCLDRLNGPDCRDQNAAT